MLPDETHELDVEAWYADLQRTGKHTVRGFGTFYLSQREGLGGVHTVVGFATHLALRRFMSGEGPLVDELSAPWPAIANGLAQRRRQRIAGVGDFGWKSLPTTTVTTFRTSPEMSRRIKDGGRAGTLRSAGAHAELDGDDL